METMRWIQREGLLNQNATNRTGTKFYTGGIAWDEKSQRYYVLFHWGEGTPTLEMLGGQVQCKGSYELLDAARQVLHKQLSAKRTRGYYSYVDSNDNTELSTRLWRIAAKERPETPVATDPTPPTTPIQNGQADALARLISMETLDNAAMQKALDLREALTNDRTRLVARLDIIDSQMELLNAKLVS